MNIAIVVATLYNRNKIQQHIGSSVEICLGIKLLIVARTQLC